MAKKSKSGSAVKTWGQLSAEKRAAKKTAKKTAAVKTWGQLSAEKRAAEPTKKTWEQFRAEQVAKHGSIEGAVEAGLGLKPGYLAAAAKRKAKATKPKAARKAAAKPKAARKAAAKPKAARKAAAKCPQPKGLASALVKTVAQFYPKAPAPKAAARKAPAKKAAKKAKPAAPQTVAQILAAARATARRTAFTVAPHRAAVKSCKVCGQPHSLREHWSHKLGTHSGRAQYWYGPKRYGKP